MSETIWRYQARLLPHPTSAGRVREFVRHRLTERGLPYLVDDIQLVASELVTSAALHTRRPFTVTLRRDDVLVQLCVGDCSHVVPPQRGVHDIDAGGRGLAIVESLSHSWGVDQGTQAVEYVWASFEVTPAIAIPT